MIFCLKRIDFLSANIKKCFVSRIKRTEEGSNKRINDFCNDINKFDQQITNGKEDAINLWIEEYEGKKNICLKLLRRWGGGRFFLYNCYLQGTNL